MNKNSMLYTDTERLNFILRMGKIAFGISSQSVPKQNRYFLSIDGVEVDKTRAASFRECLDKAIELFTPCPICGRTGEKS